MKSDERFTARNVFQTQLMVFGVLAAFVELDKVKEGLLLLVGDAEAASVELPCLVEPKVSVGDYDAVLTEGKEKWPGWIPNTIKLRYPVGQVNACRCYAQDNNT